MKKRDHLKPYIRKACKKDFHGNRPADFRTCMQAYFWKDRPKCYVLVQKDSKRVLIYGASKNEIKRKFFPTKKHINKTFNRWCNRVKKDVQK